MSQPAHRPEEIYQERRARFARERDRFARQSARVANARLLVFIAAALCLGLALWRQSPGLAGLGVLLGGGFAVLIVYHQRLGRSRRRYEALWQINDEALHRLARAWEKLPLRHTMPADPAHAYAADLDLFGRASLLHLLENASTVLGEATLSRWLLAPAVPETVRARQQAVAELAPLLDWRDELAVQGRLVSTSRPEPEPFLAWAEDEPWLTRRPVRLWGARLSVLLLWSTLLAQIFGLLPSPLWLVFLAGHAVLGVIVYQPVSLILMRAASQAGAFVHYAAALQLIATASPRAPALTQLQAELVSNGVTAEQHMRRLHTLTLLVLPRATLPAMLLRMFFLWDVQVLAALEGWQARVGSRARRWLGVLGEVEALAALASVKHDNPGWTFPDLERAAPALVARDLGHPLIAAPVRMVNDVEVGPAGTFLLVTGSNMSGKSTLLRAIGVNAVLAGAGGPVCAASFHMPPLTLWTSMRVQDSLERGVSYFMAELQRLKQIVDAARAAQAAEQPLLYLLDEILQGTNTAERQVAARRIIRHLLLHGALGAVSTHDLTLADTPLLADVARAVYFTETILPGVDRPRMTFDYRLRPGIATSTNALRLMEMVGLALDQEESQPC